MKKYLYLLAFALIFLSLFTLVSCGGCNHSVQGGYPVVSPTCTESGIGEMVCGKCGKVTETYTIYPSGHQYDVIKEVESTCTEQGYVARVCIKCDDIIILEYLELAGHVEEIIPGVESTCTEHGTTDGKKCSVCQTVLVAQEEAPLKAHTYDNDEDTTCNVCGYERYCLHRNTVVLEGKDATCTSTGLTEGKKCEDCNEILVEQEVVSMLEHDYKNLVVKNPTCELQGFVAFSCDCGAYYQDYYTDPLGHDYSNWYMYRDETTPIEGEGRRDCQRENCEHYDTHVASSGFTYSVNSGQTTCILKGMGTCADTELFLPFNIDGYEVTIIESGAFRNLDFITSVVIPDSITSISYQCFYYCTSLTNVVIPNSVTSINGFAFDHCTSLESIVIPESVTNIAYYAFSNTSIASIDIPVSVTSIGPYAFENCSLLKSIEIPSSVTSIASYTFRNCTSLESVEIGNSVKIIDKAAFLNCSKLAKIKIPDSVTSIGEVAFGNCTSLEDVYYEGDIEDWLKILFSSEYSNPMRYATNLYFGGKLVTDVVVPEFVTSIDSMEFYNWTSLKTITIPDSVTSIGDNAFANCYSLTNIDIPYSVISIGNNAFVNCNSLTNVVIGDSVTSIGDFAFDSCSSLTSVEISDSVTSIGNYAFYDCDSLTSVEIPDSVTSIGVYAFAYCKKLTIYCEAESKPEGWDSDWNPDDRPVVWGYKGE